MVGLLSQSAYWNSLVNTWQPEYVDKLLEKEVIKMIRRNKHGIRILDGNSRLEITSFDIAAKEGDVLSPAPLKNRVKSGVKASECETKKRLTSRPFMSL